MNKHKLRRIENYINGFGRLPTNRWGQVMTVDELMAYFGLEDDDLDEYERAFIRMELAAMVEADLFMDRFRFKRG